MSSFSRWRSRGPFVAGRRSRRTQPGLHVERLEDRSVFASDVAADAAPPPDGDDAPALAAATTTVSGPTTADEGDELTFTATTTSVVDLYQWRVTYPSGTTRTLASGVVALGVVPDFEFTPPDSGEYTIALVLLVDPPGNSGPIEEVDGGSLTLTVANVAPQPSISGPETGAEGSSVTYTGAFTDPAGALDGDYSYRWEARDSDGNLIASATGSRETPGAVGDFTFTPPDDGAYRVTLTVAEAGSGAPSGSAEADLVVSDVAPALEVTGATTGVRNAAAVFEGSFTDPAEEDDGPYAYSWSVTGPDGFTGSASGSVEEPGDVDDFSFTPTRPGVYTITFTVRDADGVETTIERTYTVGNPAPDPTITGPATGNEGTSVGFTGSFSDDLNDGPYTYTWLVTGPGGFTSTVTGSATEPGAVPSFDFTPATFGTYTITLTIEDDFGVVGTETFDFVALDVAPTPTVAGPTTGNEGSPLMFTGSIADPGTGETYEYVWSVTGPDGFSYATEPATAPEGAVPGFTFTPPDDGTYVVRLTVRSTTNPLATEVFDEHTVNVANVAPTVVVVDPPDGVQGTPVAVNGGFSDPAGAADAPYTYTWTVTGPGGFSQTVTGTRSAVGSVPTFNFTPVGAGDYVVTLTINDGSGDVSQSVTVSVSNLAPTTNVTGPTRGPEGQNATFVGSFVDPGGATDGPYTYTWTVTNSGGTVIRTVTGTVASPGLVPSLDFTPPDDGSFTIRLVVADSSGASDEDARSFVATNVAPSATIDGPSVIDEGDAVTYTGSFTDPAGTNDGPYTYTWTVTDSSGTVVRTVTGTVASPGAVPGIDFGLIDDGRFTLTLRVSEADPTIFDEVSLAVTVRNVPPSPTVSGPTSFDEGATVTYTGSFSDPAGTNDGPYAYTWTVTDATGAVVRTVSGSVASPGAVPNFTFTAPDDGRYTVTLRVVEDGGLGAPGEFELVAVALDVAPSPVIGGPTSGAEGSPVTYTGSFTDPGDANDGPYTYTWTVTGPDRFSQSYTATVARPGAVAAFTFTPPDDGAYLVTLTVTDADGVSNVVAAEIALTVDNVVPTIGGYYFADPATGAKLSSINEGQRVLLVGYITDPGTRDSFRVTVDPRDGGGTRTFNITSPVRDADGRITFELEVFYLFPGVYTVLTTASDGDGPLVTNAQSIVVSDIPGFAVTIDPPPVVIIPQPPSVGLLAPPRVDLTVPVTTTSLTTLYASGSSGPAQVTSTDAEDLKIRVWIDELTGLRGSILRSVKFRVLFDDQVDSLLAELQGLEPGVYRVTLDASSGRARAFEFEIQAGDRRAALASVARFWDDFGRQKGRDPFDVDFFKSLAEAQAELEKSANPAPGDQTNRAAPVAPRDAVADPEAEPSSLDGWRLALGVSLGSPDLSAALTPAAR